MGCAASSSMVRVEGGPDLRVRPQEKAEDCVFTGQLSVTVQDIMAPLYEENTVVNVPESNPFASGIVSNGRPLLAIWPSVTSDGSRVHKWELVYGSDSSEPFETKCVLARYQFLPSKVVCGFGSHKRFVAVGPHNLQVAGSALATLENDGWSLSSVAMLPSRRQLAMPKSRPSRTKGYATFVFQRRRADVGKAFRRAVLQTEIGITQKTGGDLALDIPAMESVLHDLGGRGYLLKSIINLLDCAGSLQDLVPSDGSLAHFGIQLYLQKPLGSTKAYEYKVEQCSSSGQGQGGRYLDLLQAQTSLGWELASVLASLPPQRTSAGVLEWPQYFIFSRVLPGAASSDTAAHNMELLGRLGADVVDSDEEETRTAVRAHSWGAMSPSATLPSKLRMGSPSSKNSPWQAAGARAANPSLDIPKLVHMNSNSDFSQMDTPQYSPLPSPLQSPSLLARRRHSMTSLLGKPCTPVTSPMGLGPSLPLEVALPPQQANFISPEDAAHEPVGFGHHTLSSHQMFNPLGVMLQAPALPAPPPPAPLAFTSSDTTTPSKRPVLDPQAPLRRHHQAPPAPPLASTPSDTTTPSQRPAHDRRAPLRCHRQKPPRCTPRTVAVARMPLGCSRVMPSGRRFLLLSAYHRQPTTPLPTRALSLPPPPSAALQALKTDAPPPQMLLQPDRGSAGLLPQAIAPQSIYDLAQPENVAERKMAFPPSGPTRVEVREPTGHAPQNTIRRQPNLS
eukprot:CAMPEP_0114546756 /NCGR_PEP_ID=MMETSP0114-20121206/4101_1 /TAXON_ID=31324 /ORGANISM="Goniomonas sp, Strain m" /LENGTH=731 /DNA_ID=CAMNT_0001731267 /DNA_START=24 /DNA_END=2218 /DNA_ORIENTATION=+